MIEIVFIRHGQTQANINQEASDLATEMQIGLTDLGIQQANLVQEKLKNEVFDVIFSSDMKRAQETAHIVFGDRYDIILDERLREGRVSVTPGAIYNYGDIPKEIRMNLRLTGFENGEPYGKQVERIKNFIEDISKRGYTKIGVVTHNGCLRTLPVIVHGISLEESITLPRTENLGIIRLLIDNSGKMQL